MEFFEEYYGKHEIEKRILVYSPVTGTVIRQEDVEDDVFNGGYLGMGCAVEPSEESVYAPFRGTVISVEQKECMITVKSRKNVVLAVNVDLAAADMEIPGFEYLVKEGQEIQRGEEMVRFSKAEIEKSGRCATVGITVMNPEEVGVPQIYDQRTVRHGERLMEIRKGLLRGQQINSLRTAVALLREHTFQLIETDVEIDPKAELSGVYRYVGAGGTVKRPTRKNGPAMLFHRIKGHPDASVLIGLLASRERVGKLLGCRKERLGKLLRDSVAHPVPPIVTKLPALCQENIHLATDPDFDLFKLIPAPTNTPLDAGPYITMGMCYATHPETGKSDVTIHRMCIQSKDELSIFLQPGSRHIGAMAEKAEELGKPLPISVSIGVDPAIEIGACFEPPTTPLGYDELAVAGAIRKKPVVLHKCVSIDEYAIANAEYVIEGAIQPGVRVVEDQNTHTGYAMPEFPGYNGKASDECWLIKVKAVTHRNHPIMQSVIGPSEEHVNLAGIPTEASILTMLGKALPGFVHNAYAHSAGGGKYMIILQCHKKVHTDEGKQRQAALLAFAAFSELKHVILVDEDVDIFDTDDVLWAMNTRFQGDRDLITIPGVRCHPLDPSANHEYSVLIPDIGVSCKLIFDCTIPFRMKEHFERAKFMEVDYTKWTGGE